MLPKNSIFALLYSTSIFFILFLILSFTIFWNSINNDFAVVDDLPGYIENETIRSIPKSIATLKIQEVVYSLNYHFVGINPTPLRIFTIINHAVAVYLLFLIIQYLYNRKIATVSSILFLAHPVTTETINWVSAQFYVVMAIFIFISILLLIAYRETNKKYYIYCIGLLFALDIILIRHAWVLILPLSLIIFDYFFLKKQKTQQFYNYFLGIIIPLTILFIIFNFSGQFTQRLLSRSESGKILQNEQSLTPVLQGYPFTIYSLLRLYIYPKDLTVYYDGSKITSTTHLLMYVSFLAYVGAIVLSYKKNKRIAGILILLLVFILPVLSPKKITWFITERYLYLGTGFFTTLLTLLLFEIEKKVKLKHVAFCIAGIILILYISRTIFRNSDWKNPETLAFATIKTSPYSVRPYNDLAGYYVMEKKYDKAKEYYVKALSVSSSLTAVRNLGHIYLENGFDTKIQTIQQPSDLIYNEALRMLQNQEYYAAAYYLNEALSKDQQNSNIKNRIAELYVLYEKKDVARRYIEDMKNSNTANADTYYIEAFIAYSEKDYTQTAVSLQKTLSINPNHQAALQLRSQLPVN